jgi:hypothetical protein
MRAPPPPSGAQHHLAKLNEDAVRAILADKRTQAAIARDYGVHFTIINKIKLRKTWKHVQPLP